MNSKTKTKPLDWKHYYKLPLESDGYNYAWDKNGNMALMFDFSVPKEDRNKIIASVNGETEDKIGNISFKGVDFFIGDNYIFCIRGWGNLTGIGANNLPQEKAAIIQDGFRDYVFARLKIIT